MAASGKPMSHEFQTNWSPEEVVRYIVLQAGSLDALGYRVEHHTAGGAVLVRRFTPNIAWAAPLCIAGIIFGLGIFGPNATVESASVAGRISLFAVIAAVVLGLVVKTNERVTLSANPDKVGSRVVVSGTTTPRLCKYIVGLGELSEADRSRLRLNPAPKRRSVPESAVQRVK